MIGDGLVFPSSIYLFIYFFFFMLGHCVEILSNGVFIHETLPQNTHSSARWINTLLAWRTLTTSLLMTLIGLLLCTQWNFVRHGGSDTYHVIRTK